jgi:hypothetical protein
VGGEDSWDDTTIRKHILESELGDRIDFMIQPSVSALSPNPDYRYGDPIDFDRSETRDNLKDVFRYLDRNFFNRLNHVTLRERPAVTVFGTNFFEGSFGEAFQESKNVASETPFIVADSAHLVTSARTGEDEFRGIDAVTKYNMYFPRKVAELDFRGYVDYVADLGLRWRLGAENRSVGFVPVVMPGSDDTLVRDRTGSPLEPTPEHFRQLIDSQEEYMDPDLDAVFVTSWNEWYEDSVVEPNEEYGMGYLDIIASDIAEGDVEPLDVDGEYDRFRIDFNTTVPSDSGERELAFMLHKLEMKDAEGDRIAAYDIGERGKEPVFVEGAYRPASSSGEWDTWRWLGGETGESVMYMERTEYDVAVAILVGTPMVDNKIEADFYYNNQYTDHLEFGERTTPREFAVSVDTE